MRGLQPLGHRRDPCTTPCRQVIAEGARQADDPAVRLISLQLGFLLNVGRVLDPAEYTGLVETCRARATERGSTVSA